MKIDTGIGFDLKAVPERAVAAERAGLDRVIAAETVNDPFLSMAVAAEHTGRIELGTGVAIAFARNPMSMAYTVNQLQEFSGGRVMIGLGSQVRGHIERRFSAVWSHPAARMREFVLAMRSIWSSWNDGAELDFRGEFYNHTLMTPLFTPRPHTFGTPRVFLAAVGERMTEVAGEVADGVITHGFSSARYVREVTIPALERGLKKAGRSRSDFEVTCPGFIAVADREDKLERIRADMRRQVAFYASTPAYRPVLEVHGWGDIQPELYECSRRGAWDEMARLVDDEVLDTITIVTTPDRLADEVRSRYGGIADRIMAAWWQKEWWADVEPVLRAI
ncbi:MAG TPA: TIGR03617 family F420-dependent LLM class oxidoreductase [Acidimicrobiales bacterium]|nr:TIGR03617 family F420-dependent LLM class oxidoreductase [Acidimicrobiales bacterium]